MMILTKDNICFIRQALSTNSSSTHSVIVTEANIEHFYDTDRLENINESAIRNKDFDETSFVFYKKEQKLLYVSVLFKEILDEHSCIIDNIQDEGKNRFCSYGTLVETYNENYLLNRNYKKKDTISTGNYTVYMFDVSDKVIINLEKIKNFILYINNWLDSKRRELGLDEYADIANFAFSGLMHIGIPNMYVNIIEHETVFRDFYVDLLNYIVESKNVFIISEAPPRATASEGNTVIKSLDRHVYLKRIYERIEKHTNSYYLQYYYFDNSKKINESPVIIHNEYVML